MNKIDLFTHSTIGPALAEAATSCRMVFFTGLPASGKSFLLRQQCLAAANAGRRIHILQWDACLSAFLSESNLAKYPQVDGNSNPVIRHAANLWGRRAVARWHAAFPDPNAILIGEVPILGNRFSELVQVRSGKIESILASETTRFYFPVPSIGLRDTLEGIRRTSFADPQHPDEAKDAPPSTMEWAWRIARSKAVDLGLVQATETANYDPTTSHRFFEYLLQHREATAFYVEQLFPIDSSAHDLDTKIDELLATPSEVTHAMELVENAMNSESTEQDLDNWYRV